ncbi:hypothetical protein BDY21DRAFT_158523 [Lineolata rhizophorae]|uniref:Uncharacterized protein n=1 Tax=Lineolata rhizophorae TaxID=578093 RepID=A0A6A6NL88_9PEZI|nr:hypothetical protein BDY21DRAFT_158523 [Lineolata rhizophorae]
MDEPAGIRGRRPAAALVGPPSGAGQPVLIQPCATAGLAARCHAPRRPPPDEVSGILSGEEPLGRDRADLARPRRWKTPSRRKAMALPGSRRKEGGGGRRRFVPPSVAARGRTRRKRRREFKAVNSLRLVDLRTQPALAPARCSTPGAAPAV